MTSFVSPKADSQASNGCTIQSLGGCRHLKPTPDSVIYLEYTDAICYSVCMMPRAVAVVSVSLPSASGRRTGTASAALSATNGHRVLAVRGPATSALVARRLHSARRIDANVGATTSTVEHANVDRTSPAGIVRPSRHPRHPRHPRQQLSVTPSCR